MGGSYSASPILVDGSIYVSNEQGDDTTPNPERFELLAINQLGNEIYLPVVANDRLFLRVAHTEGENRSESDLLH